MRRATTVRTLFAVLVAVLLALQLSAPTTAFASTFASAHTDASAHTSAHPHRPAGPAAAAEFVTCAETSHSHGPTGPLRSRDRVRVTDHVPPASARPLLVKDVVAAHEDPAHTSAPAAHHRTTRSSADRSTAALQVFRC